MKGTKTIGDELEAKQGIEVISQEGTEEVNSSLADIVSEAESNSTQTTDIAQKNNAQVEVTNKVVSVMNGANEKVERLEKELSKFKTEKKEDKGKK